jgi:hypothetical protein
MKRMGKVSVVVAGVIFVLSMASAKAADLETVRFHLECGWLEQLLTGETTDIGEAAGRHIVAGAKLAADLSIERERIGVEVSGAYHRVFDGNSDKRSLQRRLTQCRKALKQSAEN